MKQAFISPVAQANLDEIAFSFTSSSDFGCKD